MEEEYNKYVINFSNTKDKILYELHNMKKKCNTDNQEDLFLLYQSMLRTRHDIIHYTILNACGYDWKEEQKIGDYFRIKGNEHWLNQTPDIIFDKYLDDKLVTFIIEISVSVDLTKSELLKQNKYNDLLNNLFAKKLNIIFIHINLKPSFSNIESEINKIMNYMTINFDYMFINNAQELIEEQNRWLSKFLDKEYFEKKKRELYNTDQILPEDVGMYSDIFIDVDYFNEFNDKFQIMNKIEETIDNTNEDVLVSFLKDVLEDEKSEIYQKYKDGKLTDDQFDIAKSKIEEDNSSREILEPKPTHHVIVPCYEDIDGLFFINEDEKLNEQKMIFNFINKIKELKKENTGNDYYVFCFELLSKIDEIFKTTSEKNNEINMEIFEKGYYRYEDQNTHDAYTMFKACCEIITLYNKKSKKEISIKSRRVLGVDNKIVDETIYNIVNDKLKKYDLLKYVTDLKPNFSYLEFLKMMNLYDESDDIDKAIKTKTVFCSFKNLSETSQKIWSKTGIQHFKNDPSFKKNDVGNTISFDNKIYVNEMINYLSQKPEIDHKYKNDYMFDHYNSYDSDEAKKMKEVMTIEYKKALEKLKETNSYYYLYKSHDIIKQLLHFTCLNLKTKSFSLFNTGIPNMLCLVAGCYNKLFSENGKPFMFIILTKKPDYYTKFFGKLNIIELDNGHYLVISNWRRLPTSKLTHMKDSYYSVLSSTMNSIMSAHDLLPVALISKYEKIFSIRTIISLSTTQKISEILMDTRYAYMSSLSLYTNIDKLLYDKFGPPYKNCLEVWIVNKLLTRLKIINQAVKDGKITLNIPEYVSGKRNLETTGGKIEMPSLWSDEILLDINEILDEIFIYVHTPKEPSNIFHENVKALKTIIEFQEDYDNLPEYIKYGDLKTKNDLSRYLLNNSKIGCSARTIYDSTNYTLDLNKPNIKKIIHNINNESISEIISTKAVIKDVDRQLISDNKPTKREYTKFAKKMKEYQGVDNINEDDYKKYYLKTVSNHYNVRKMRQKVFETTLDYISEYDYLHTTVDVANHFIKKEKGKVVADICIKSQYGSKREFYVINFGAKALARCGENFFKQICEQTDGEAISIPGDKKLIAMQNMLDRILLNIPDIDDYKIAFVNGDCTKWSAAETMTSFLSMTKAFENKISNNMYVLLKTLFNAWSNKDIQVPIDIINKVLPPMVDVTVEQRKKLSYLLKESVKYHGKFKSTQNFLQGMFNYASSFKAICCLNYTYKIWRQLYGSKEIIVEHMAHSDDYVSVILYRDLKILEKFRVLQKIMMRLHGYNDSERKTNCQNIFMEFVSLLSFNGVMLYPQIKKAKEVNTNTPCIGYKQDIESALSRTGECLRIGCNLSFCYFFEKLHIMCVADAYSLLPNMTNNCNRNMEKLLNTPVELFGLPDMLPLFLLFCRGSGNNYRLYTYGTFHEKKLIEFLYLKSIDVKNVEKYASEDIDYAYSLLTPIFLYDTNNKSLKNLRKSIDWKPDQCNDFWENHISYRFLKPRTRLLLTMWLKSMFFNRTFTEAYTKANRTKMTMRLSSFVKNSCIKTAVEINEYFNQRDLHSNTYDIKNYINYVLDEYDSYPIEKINNLSNTDRTQILKIITKCDPTFSTIYSLLTGIVITEQFMKKKKLIQIGMKTPPKIRSFELNNNPELIIQMLYNPDDALIDKRLPKSYVSLSKDIENIKKRIDPVFLESKNTLDVLTVYNDLKISKEKPLVMMGYNVLSKQLVYVLSDILKYNYIPYRYCNTTIHGITKVIDPFTNSLLYVKGSKMEKDLHIHSLENICLLYVVYVRKLKKTVEEFKTIIRQFMFIIDKKNNTMKNYLEVLNQFSIAYCEQFELPNYQIRIAAYLQSVLTGDLKLLNYLISSAYSFTYNFTKRAQLVGGKYKGISEFTFSHFKNYQKVIQYEDKNKCLILYEKLKPNFFDIHYNITQHILGKIDENQFHKYAYEKTYKLDKLPFDTQDQLDKFLNEEKILFAYSLDNTGKLMQVNKKDIDIEQYYLPFLSTKKSLYQDTSMKKDIEKLYTSIDHNNLIVKVGKQKAFMLPYWRCDCTNNIFAKNEIYNYIDNVFVVDLLKNNNLKNYLMGDCKNLSFENIKLDMDTIINDIKQKIPENRLYWWEHRSIYNYIRKEHETTELESILNLEKISKKKTPYQYDMKFLKKTKQEENISEYSEKDILTFEEKAFKEKMNEIVGDFGLGGDDFLVDVENSENITGFLDEEEYEYLPTQALTQQRLMSSLNFEFKLDDSFLVQPSKPKYKRKSKYLDKVNFLLNRLDHLPRIDSCWIIKNNSTINEPKSITLPDYISNLKIFCKQNNILKKYKDNGIKLNDDVYFNNIVFIYKLLCESYIKPVCGDNFSFSINLNKDINYKYKSKIPKTDSNLKKVFDNENIKLLNSETIDVDNFIYYEIFISVDTFMKKFMDMNTDYKIDYSMLKKPYLKDYLSIKEIDELDSFLIEEEMLYGFL